MNKFGIFSLLMAIASIILFFIMRGPNANITMAAIVLGTLSLLGLTFAILSKTWLSGIWGGLVNITVLIFVFFLLLAKGIAG